MKERKIDRKKKQGGRGGEKEKNRKMGEGNPESKKGEIEVIIVKTFSIM